MMGYKCEHGPYPGANGPRWLFISCHSILGFRASVNACGIMGCHVGAAACRDAEPNAICQTEARRVPILLVALAELGHSRIMVRVQPLRRPFGPHPHPSQIDRTRGTGPLPLSLSPIWERGRGWEGGEGVENTDFRTFSTFTIKEAHIWTDHAWL